MAKDRHRTVKKVNLALQGGGALGAYTWGVLDRLLEDPHLEIDSISGTSAGAMNGAVLVDGYAKGGRDGAREALKNFWENISKFGAFSPLQHLPFQQMFKSWNMDWSPTYALFDLVTRVLSPYQTNPLNINPLRDAVAKSIDFHNLRNAKSIQLFVAATSVTTGQPRIFSHNELTVDAIMASACLPFLYQAVEIDGDAYWDGGYVGNPSIWPLTYHSKTSDVIVVEVNPIVRPSIPRDGKDIINRLNEISFNTSLIAEMRSINFVNRLINANHLNNPNYRKLNVHLISSPKEMLKMNASSKFNVSWDFFEFLHNLGRNAADHWIEKNFSCIGVKSSVDIEKVFLAHVRQPNMTKHNNKKNKRK